MICLEAVLWEVRGGAAGPRCLVGIFANGVFLFCEEILPFLLTVEEVSDQASGCNSSLVLHLSRGSAMSITPPLIP